MEPGTSNSLEQMAEEIFALTVMSWRQRISKQHGDELSESQYLAIDTLARAEGGAGGGILTVGEIQRAIGVLPAQMSRIIRSLESTSTFEKPLIRCELNQSDKRKIDVHLLPEGRRAYDEFRQSRLSKTVQVLQKLPDHDRQEFIRICGIIRNLSQESQ